MSEWTAEAIETLYRLIGEGRSFGEIGVALGVSRNAVAGRVHRLRIVRPKPTAPTAPAEPAVPGVVERGDTAPRKARSAAPSRPTTAPARSAQPGAPRPRPIVLPRPKPAGDRPEIDPGRPDPTLAVVFVERRSGQCAAILDDRAPIETRLVCGAPVSGSSPWCAHHRLRYTTLQRVVA